MLKACYRCEGERSNSHPSEVSFSKVVRKNRLHLKCSDVQYATYLPVSDSVLTLLHVSWFKMSEEANKNELEGN